MLQENNYFEIILAGTLFLFLISLFIIVLYMLFTKRLVQNELKLEKIKTNHQKELLSNEISVVERERERIARDLHDEIGPVLSIISINMSKQTGNKETNQEMLANKKMLDDSIINIRRITHSILPPSLEMLGLIPTLEDITQNISESFSIKIDSNHELNDLTKHITIQLYRVFMELINNSIKHSGGDAISLKIKRSGSSIHFDYEDNGQGFQQKIAHKPGLGLMNIESRLSAINATHEIVNRPGKGFKVLIQIEI